MVMFSDTLISRMVGHKACQAAGHFWRRASLMVAVRQRFISCTYYVSVFPCHAFTEVVTQDAQASDCVISLWLRRLRWHIARS